MLTIDFEPPQEYLCNCCGGKTVTLTRFVHDEEGPVAVYKARFGLKHPERVVEAIVSIGGWGDSSGPWDRVAGTILGRLLDREEALGHERLQEVFHITDHMVAEDSPLRDYLAGTA